MTLTATANPGYKAQASELYESAFPSDERRPTKEWLDLMDHEETFHVLYITNDSDEFLGFIAYWDFETFAYIEHFAVKPSSRGHGYGGTALDRFLSMNQDRCIILEVEPPTNTIAEKRIAFYRRHGLQLLPVSYIQPPYSQGKQAMPLKLMAKGTTPTHEETLRMISIIKTSVYRVEATK